jgi:putative phage-type endonuclease
MNMLGIYWPSPEWYAARIGLVTSSKIHDAITPRQKNKPGESKPKHELPELAARHNLKMQMISEMLTGRTVEHYNSPAMEWGVDQEPHARKEYEFRTGREAEAVGLVMHPTNARAAATADGWVKEEGGLLEIKCPETYTHLEYMASGIIPPEYLDQIDWQMACAGPEIEWCDFVSYDPRIENADELQMLIVRRERNQKRIEEMEEACSQFLIELIQLFEQIKRGRPSLTTQLERSLEARKAFRKVHDAELLEQYKKEAIQVP